MVFIWNMIVGGEREGSGAWHYCTCPWPYCFERDREWRTWARAMPCLNKNYLLYIKNNIKTPSYTAGSNSGPLSSSLMRPSNRPRACLLNNQQKFLFLLQSLQELLEKWGILAIWRPFLMQQEPRNWFLSILDNMGMLFFQFKALKLM